MIVGLFVFKLCRKMVHGQTVKTIHIPITMPSGTDARQQIDRDYYAYTIKATTHTSELVGN